MSRLAILPLLICSIAHGSPQEADQDVYAIYSVMLTNPKTSHGADNNPRYLIGATPVRGTPEQPCVQPPTERQAEFRAVLADYDRRKAEPRQLKRSLSIAKPYILLTPDEVKRFMASRGLAPGNPPPADERFQGVSDVFQLTDVYFNPDRTLALTAISTWCGSLCALYQWKVFEKSKAGLWEERDWSACMTIARR